MIGTWTKSTWPRTTPEAHRFTMMRQAVWSIMGFFCFGRFAAQWRHRLSIGRAVFFPVPDARGLIRRPLKTLRLSLEQRTAFPVGTPACRALYTDREAPTTRFRRSFIQ